MSVAASSSSSSSLALMPLENLIERLQFVRLKDRQTVKLTRLLIDQTININVKVRSEQATERTKFRVAFFCLTHSQLFTAKLAFIYNTICG